MSKKSLIATISVASGLFIIFVVITAVILANGKAALPVDSSVAEWAYQIRGEKGNFAYWFFRIITECGYYYFAVSFILILAIVWKFKSKAWFLAAPVFIAWALHKIIKWIINRPRPDATLWWVNESSSSFPSGHSTTVTAIFVLVIFFIFISPYLKTWLKWLLSSVCGAVIILVPLSRVWFGVHYFTDVIAGMCLGGTCAVLGIMCYLIYKSKKQQKTNAQIENQVKEK